MHNRCYHLLRLRLQLNLQWIWRDTYFRSGLFSCTGNTLHPWLDTSLLDMPLCRIVFIVSFDWSYLPGYFAVFRSFYDCQLLRPFVVTLLL